MNNHIQYAYNVEAGPVYDEPSSPSRPNSYKSNVRIILLFERESQEISAPQKRESQEISARRRSKASGH